MNVSFALVGANWRRLSLSREKKISIRSVLERHGKDCCANLDEINVRSIEKVDNENVVVCVFWDVELKFVCDPIGGRVSVRRVGYLRKDDRYRFYQSNEKPLHIKFIPNKDIGKLR